MTRVQIIGPRTELDACIRVLHELALVHIDESGGCGGEGGRTRFERLPLERERLEEKRILDHAHDTLTTLISLLEKPPSYTPVAVMPEEIPSMTDELRGVLDRVKTLHALEDELADELKLVRKYERLLRGFAPMVSRLGGFRSFAVDGLTLTKTREDVAGLLEEELERITDGLCEVYTRDLDPETLGVVVAYPTRFAPEVKALVSGRSISEIRLPDEYENRPILDALKDLRVRAEKLPGRIEEAGAELREASRRWYPAVEGALKAVEDARDEIGALAYAGQTRFTFMVEGWLPTDRLSELIGRFATGFGDKVFVREMEIADEEYDLVPVCIKNPRLLRPFELFLAALPPPRYGSVDPTPFVAFFFPAFFGLIVGDLGYGLLITAGAFLVRRKVREGFHRDILTVFVVCGLSASLFGILFGELFGDLGERLHVMHPILMHRTGALRSLLVITLGIGVGHVVLGLVIGFVNRLTRGRRREAGAKLAYLVLVGAFLVIIGVMFERLPEGYMTPGFVALVAGLAALILTEGALGPLEFVKTLGNILSYVRLMAVGTASVVMALVANEIGGVSENLLVGILAAGVIHLFNIFLAILSPVIQSMRLQYVEFFSKFFEGGGRRYVPFRKR